jgi:hypothetical protein
MKVAKKRKEIAPFFVISSIKPGKKAKKPIVMILTCKEKFENISDANIPI